MGSAIVQCLMCLAAALWVTMIHSSTAVHSLTAYEVLKENNLPVGILPLGVAGYDLNNSTGEFSVKFNESCKITVRSFDVTYDTVIKGNISEGKISGAEGVAVKILFASLKVDEIVREGDDLRFSAGVASQTFPVSDFTTSPNCQS